MAKSTSNAKNTDEISKLFGLTSRRVQQLAKEGIIPATTVNPYSFELEEAVKAYVEYLTNNGKKDRNSDVKKAENDKIKAEADLKKTKASIAKIQLRELEGKMHRSEDVEAVMIDIIYHIKNMILALPGRLAIDVINKTAAEASELIKMECYKILEELSTYKYDPEEYQKRVREREGWSELLNEEDN